LQSIKLIFGRLLLLLWLLLLEPNVDDLDAAGSFGWHSPTSVKSCHELFVRSVECKSNSPEGGGKPFPSGFPFALVICEKKYEVGRTLTPGRGKNKIKVPADRFNLFKSVLNDSSKCHETNTSIDF
jgi:hypothetical protein